jgi:hypothetical protein
VRILLGEGAIPGRLTDAEQGEESVVTNEVDRRKHNRGQLVPTSWSEGRLFFLEATCSLCGQISPASKDGAPNPGECERQIRAESVEHVYSKHRHSS